MMSLSFVEAEKASCRLTKGGAVERRGVRCAAYCIVRYCSAFARSEELCRRVRNAAWVNASVNFKPLRVTWRPPGNRRADRPQCVTGKLKNQLNLHVKRFNLSYGASNMQN